MQIQIRFNWWLELVVAFPSTLKIQLKSQATNPPNPRLPDSLTRVGVLFWPLVVHPSGVGKVHATVCSFGFDHGQLNHIVAASLRLRLSEDASSVFFLLLGRPWDRNQGHTPFLLILTPKKSQKCGSIWPWLKTEQLAFSRF